jgi:hypothetical protein
MRVGEPLMLEDVGRGFVARLLAVFEVPRVSLDSIP